MWLRGFFAKQRDNSGLTFSVTLGLVFELVVVRSFRESDHLGCTVVCGVFRQTWYVAPFSPILSETTLVTKEIP